MRRCTGSCACSTAARTRCTADGADPHGLRDVGSPIPAAARSARRGPGVRAARLARGRASRSRNACSTLPWRRNRTPRTWRSTPHGRSSRPNGSRPVPCACATRRPAHEQLDYGKVTATRMTRRTLCGRRALLARRMPDTRFYEPTAYGVEKRITDGSPSSRTRRQGARRPLTPIRYNVCMLDIGLLLNDLPPSRPRSRSAALRSTPRRSTRSNASARTSRRARRSAPGQRNASSKQIGIARAGRGRVRASRRIRGPRRHAEVARDRARLRAGEAARLCSCCPTSRTRRFRPGAPKRQRRVRRWGVPRAFDFPAKDHADLGEALGCSTSRRPASFGARFRWLRGDLARLHRPSRSSCSTCRRASTATSSTTRPTSSTPRRSSARRSPEVRGGHVLGPQGRSGSDDAPMYLSRRPRSRSPIRALRDPRWEGPPAAPDRAHAVLRSEAGATAKTRAHDPPAPVRQVEMVQIAHPSARTKHSRR